VRQDKIPDEAGRWLYPVKLDATAHIENNDVVDETLNDPLPMRRHDDFHRPGFQADQRQHIPADPPKGARRSLAPV
jgi:hypothetical protein